MLVATLEQERKKLYQQGRMEAQQQTIGQLLNFRFDLEQAERQTFAHQVAQIQNLQHLNELIDTLLNKAAQLEDFTQLLEKYLPADLTK